MGFDPEKLLDHAGLELLRLLHENARMSFAELGKHVGLTPPAAAERLRRMEEAGIIEAYRVVVNAAKLGAPIKAFIRVSDCEPCERLVAAVRALSSVRECHQVTGSDSYILQVEVASIEALNQLIEHLRPFARTLVTAIVLSTAFDDKPPNAEHADKSAKARAAY